MDYSPTLSHPGFVSLK